MPNHVEASGHSSLEQYEKLAEDLLAVYASSDGGALRRLNDLFASSFTVDELRSEIQRRWSGANEFTLADAQHLVARLYGFESWAKFAESTAQPPSNPRSASHGLSSTPPFYKIDRKENTIEPRPPLFPKDWDTIFDVMADMRITGLNAGGQMTDAALERLSRLEHVSHLNLAGSRRLTDQGLQLLARLPQLQHLELTGCQITDRGLEVLRQLSELKSFRLNHHAGVSDAGLSNLEFCERLERVELLGSNSGDGALRALTGKRGLRHVKTGNHITNAGLALLREFPVFKNWQGGKIRMALMEFEAEPNYLLLRGSFTDEGLANLAGLDGLFALNLDDSKLAVTASGLKSLVDLPNLGWLGFDATDEAMRHISAMPRLRMLMCQDTAAGDDGFTALSRSQSIEYIWGRRCHNLTGRGFAAMAGMPALRGLSVSCKNVDDAALSTLPAFPSLTGFMPMDVPDEGFRHVGRCGQLEALWCMYCRDTGDTATEHIHGLSKLKTYYAGGTRITNHSLEILGRMLSLEEVTLWACAGVTNAGVAALAGLPGLREINLESLPGVTREAAAVFPSSVRVNYSA